MKKLQFFLLLIVFFGFMTTSAFAAAISPNGPTGLTAGQSQAPSNGASKVPQAQIDRVKKREAMNAKRAELLKVRQQLIDTNNPGNVNGQQTIQ